MAHQNAVQDELNITWFKFFCVDQSSRLRAVISWMVFLAFGVLVPALSVFALYCTDCSSSKPYEMWAQLWLSSVASLSFICLSIFIQKSEIPKFLFLNMLRNVTVDVRDGYTQQFNRSVATVFVFVLPCFAIEVAHKMWWYSHGGIQFWGNVIVSNSVVWVVCMLELCSWFYRTVIFFLVCVLFRLACTLQILRIQYFGKVFYDHPDVQSLMSEHLRTRNHLTVISQRFGLFILGSLIYIITSQFASLYIIIKPIKPEGDVNIHDIGELTACCVTLLVGLLIILKSAARITHKTHAVTSFVAKWHVCSTIESMVVYDEESIHLNEVEHEEDELNKAEFVRGDTSTSFQHRQALVSYFEKSPAGINVYGYILDWKSLCIIFGIETSVVLWLLGETIFLSLK